MPKKKSVKKAPAKGAKKSIKKSAPQKRAPETDLSFIHALMPFVLVIIAVFLLICLFFTKNSGVIGKALHDLVLGLFGLPGFIFPVILGITGIFWKRDREDGTLPKRIFSALLFMLGFSAFVHTFGKFTKVFAVQKLWQSGIALKSGGVFGGLLGSSLRSLVGIPGLVIISICMALFFGVLFTGIRFESIIKYFSSFFKQENKEPKPKKEKALTKKKKPEPYLDEGDYTEYVCEDEDPGSKTAVDPEIFDRIKNEINAGGIEIPDNLQNIQPAETEQIFIDLDDVLNEVEPISEEDIEEVLETEVTPITEELAVEEKKPVEKRPYVFPPMTLLNLDKKPNTEDVTEELRTNATKLVETLASFKVRTKIIDISRGPTITRYELAPEEGVRVRQIANLVDDISLSLAASGIRIEAPIPGKAAVGIEVPNKVVSTVFLRELLENPTFKNAKSNITVSLGMDVAGAPIFVDIAKMPHLLIAGATGMGKSVCINSMIVSLLYKSTPEEVKLILIDPKKVEFNIYNGLPQLLIPVVSDPKKAAGALHWAVAEMERRFALIENVGVRDIYNFNMTTKDDPAYEYMPHVVIVIDELADLMMTAPDEVEDSICRLAQKARAAGMHLIIGTQRPSVDVITGLIKANIPSRIACTVASQVDSRTILDTAGAEKLIGRGDMLYAPVGAAKPMRVQGAFVSEQEVEAVTEFIRSKSGQSEYDNDVIEKIEKEAAKCGVKKGSGAVLDDDDDDEDADPMLRSAIELAIESGKISTSLIQRKLSLGYGRAAKLIDKMEKMGIVGAPEGNKPREVLMSRAEFLEKTMNSDVED